MYQQDGLHYRDVTWAWWQQTSLFQSWFWLTHWGRDKMAAIFQTTFSNGFSWMKMFEYPLKFHWSLLLRVKLTIFRHWFRKWLGAVQATSHYLNQWWLICWRIYASLGLNELINIKENIKAPHYWPFVMAIHRWSVDSSRKSPVIREAFTYPRY